MTKPKGYTLYSDTDIVVIATMESANRKTGNMVQLWILSATESPVDAIKNGNDVKVCGNCKYRAPEGSVNPMADKGCYVNVARAPNSIWKALQRGSYPFLATCDYGRVFGGLMMRFGAYGDPGFVPPHIIRALIGVLKRWTGYSHQWRTSDWLRPYVMASCDTPADYADARAAGWRTFRVAPGIGALPGEILCPASDEAGKRTTCARCGLCNGARPSDGRKSIYIPIHGLNAKRLIQIGAKQ